MYKCKAMLTSIVEYPRLSGEMMTLPQGTTIEVDPELDVAYYNGEHLDVNENEYEILYLN